MAKLKLNIPAFAQIRTLPTVLSLLDKEAERRAASAGPGYVATPAAATGGRVRGRASVVTGDAKSMRDEATNHNLARG